METVNRLSKPQAYLFLINTAAKFAQGENFYGKTRTSIVLKDGIPFWNTQYSGVVSEKQKSVLEKPELSKQLIDTVNSLLQFGEPKKVGGRRGVLRFTIRERLVAILRYGLGDGRPLNLKEIARELDLSPSTVRSYEENVIWRLGRAENLEQLQDFLP